MNCIKIYTNYHNKIGDYMYVDYLIVLERTILFYIVITIIYRIMGKREVGQLGIVDLIVSILIAELAAMSIDKRMDNIFLSIIPMIALVFIQMLVSYLCLKFPKIRDMLDGKPSIIINKGIINFKEMVKQRYNLDDLLIQLREEHIRTIEEVDYAILESSGKLSVFKKKNYMIGDYPLPLIIDGKVENDTLNNINKSKRWLDKKIKEKNTELKDIFYAFYKNKDLYIIKHSDLSK